jgi:ABC transport system ATP-binding/permease protein
MPRTLLTAKNLHLEYNSRILFDDLTFEIQEGMKIGIVGNNGAGKSSLLKILFDHDSRKIGDIILSSGVDLEYLTQELENDTEDKLSGGQIRKKQLNRIINLQNGIVLLDEPTNHLDLENINWLETRIKYSTSAFVIISHDRTFLDNVCNQIWELDNGKLYIHIGGYTAYLMNKQARLENQTTIDYRTKQYLKRELKWVNSGVQARGTKDKGRLSRFYEKKDNFRRQRDDKVDLLIPEPKLVGSRILEIENLNLVFNPEIDKIVKIEKFNKNEKQRKTMVRDFTWSFNKDQKIALIGKNGSGKSTFLKLILGLIPLTSGTIKMGQNTQVLYLDQHKEQLDLDNTPFEYMGNGLERIPFGAENETIGTRKYLGNWLFQKEDYNRHIRLLSGGEKSRLTLAKQLTQPANFLIFDEPTNDLDLDSIRILEEALIDYEGPVIIVSHDKSFINRICNYVFDFDGFGNIITFTGNYDEYIDYKSSKTSFLKFKEDNEPDFSDMKTASALRETKKEERRKNNLKEKLEKEIAVLELRIKEKKALFDDPEIYKDMPKVTKLHTELGRLEAHLDAIMEMWME